MFRRGRSAETNDANHDLDQHSSDLDQLVNQLVNACLLHKAPLAPVLREEARARAHTCIAGPGAREGLSGLPICSPRSTAEAHAPRIAAQPAARATSIYIYLFAGAGSSPLEGSGLRYCDLLPPPGLLLLLLFCYYYCCCCCYYYYYPARLRLVYLRQMHAPRIA